MASLYSNYQTHRMLHELKRITNEINGICGAKIVSNQKPNFQLRKCANLYVLVGRFISLFFALLKGKCCRHSMSYYQWKNVNTKRKM